MTLALQPTEHVVHLKRPHPKQEAFVRSTAKRRMARAGRGSARAGRRSGKTTGEAILAVEAFLRGKRVLYAAPTTEQIDRFWHEVRNALAAPIDAGILYKNESTDLIEARGTETRS